MSILFIKKIDFNINDIDISTKCPI